MDAIFVGGIAGLIVVASVVLLDVKLKIDDPVGAISVHLVCGIWGTMAIGLFGNLASTDQFMSQLVGVMSIGAFCALFSYATFSAIRLLVGLRVSEEVELAGLDMHEHGVSGYRGIRSANPPHISILAPNYGARVSGLIELLADAYGDGDVAGVRFTLDAQSIGEEIDTPPYFLHWDTRDATNGEHVLIAIARDAANNHGRSVPFDITIEN
jgi:hypothetical protein